MSLALRYLDQSKLLNSLFRGYAGPAFAIHFPSWTWHSAATAESKFSLILRSPEVLDRLMHPSETALGEAFVSGELDVEGNLYSAFEVTEWLLNRPMSLEDRVCAELIHDWSALAARLTKGRKHSRRRDAASVSRHYDLPVNFYEPWLGPTLLYSSAYFRVSPKKLDQAQLTEAQIAKLDLICHKLDLRSGDRFMDIGCGWGSLVIHAASKYGTRTRGITISKNQARVAARRISEARLGDQCFVELRDYRETAALPYRYDKLASIGMYEHVGVKNLRNYFEAAFDLLKPGGLFLNSGIVRALESERRKQSFIDQYVFPDGELPTLSEALGAAEEAGFEIRDVECLREHYALTLRQWVSNLQSHAAELIQVVSERTLRTWLLYMAGSAVAFERGDISVFQLLLRRPNDECNVNFCTRENWYARTKPATTDSIAA